MDLHKIWGNFTKSLSNAEREYILYDKTKNTGLRLGVFGPDKKWEIHIDIGIEGEVEEFELPNWDGVELKYHILKFSTQNHRNVTLTLQNNQHKDVYIIVCEDLIECILDIKSSKERLAELQSFFSKWTYFFESSSVKGMSEEKQRGLFGELWWLRKCLNAKIKVNEVINAWQGGENASYDFDFRGNQLEVKSTMMKEPRKVWINSEIQLNGECAKTIYLFVLTLNAVKGGGESLVNIIESINSIIDSDRVSLRKFKDELKMYGYLEIHNDKYSKTYVTRIEELFKVSAGFPRIIKLPVGTGDLKYSITISACVDFITEIDDYIKFLNGECNE